MFINFKEWQQKLDAHRYCILSLICNKIKNRNLLPVETSSNSEIFELEYTNILRHRDSKLVRLVEI